MKLFKYLMMFTVCTAAASCSEDKGRFYDAASYIQFGPENTRLNYNPNNNFSDTLKEHTLFYLPDTEKEGVIHFDLYATGKPVSYDRRVKLEQIQVEGAENAIPGVHYKAFDSEEMATVYTIKKDSTHLWLPIVMLRDQSLRSKDVTLEFRVVTNDQFISGDRRLTWRRLIFSDRLARPISWTEDVTTYYFGKFSMVKYKWMMDLSDINFDDAFIKKIAADPTAIDAWCGFFKTELIKENKRREEAEPKEEMFRDEDGELIVFP